MVIRQEDPVPLSALNIGELKPHEPHVLFRSVLLMSIGAAINYMRRDFPGAVLIRDGQVLESPLTYLHLLYEHPTIRKNVDLLLKEIRVRPELMGEDQRQECYRYATRAEVSGFFARAFSDVHRSMQTYITDRPSQARLPEVTLDVKAISNKIFAPLPEAGQPQPSRTGADIFRMLVDVAEQAGISYERLTLPEGSLSYSQYARMMQTALPERFWDAAAKLKKYAISGRRFANVVRAICNLDAFQCVAVLRKDLGGQVNDIKSTRYEEAERAVLNSYRNYLLSFWDLKVADLFQIHDTFFKTPGIDSIVSPITRRCLQGAWGEVVAAKMFTQELAKQRPEVKVKVLPVPETLDDQGIDSLVVMQMSEGAPICVVIQIKSVWHLDPRPGTYFYAFSDTKLTYYETLIEGSIASTSKIAGRDLKRRLKKIKDDLDNSTTPGTAENRHIQRLLESEMDIKQATFLPILLVVPSNPERYFTE